MSSVPTPHNSAKLKEISENVLMVGDPLRSELISKKFLKNSKLINNVRGVQGYTGTYKGKKVTVMAHGMGNPSMGIYSYELFNFYNVKKIVRAGSIGSLQDGIKCKDIIICEKVLTNTNYDEFYAKNGLGFIDGSKQLVEQAQEIAKLLNINAFVGKTFCSDNFYSCSNELELAKKFDLLGVEMESAALYINANKSNKKALTICTVSDSVDKKENLSAEERQNSFEQMIELALEIIIK